MNLKQARNTIHIRWSKMSPNKDESNVLTLANNNTNHDTHA